MPSELSQLMIPSTCSLNTQKTIICGSSLATQGQGNSPAQLGGGADDASMKSARERQRTSPPLHFSFDYKSVWQ